MRTDTIFDLASLSKLFTSIVAMQQIQAGTLDLNATVASYLPDYASNGKGDITIADAAHPHLRAAGRPDPAAVAGYPDMPSRIKAILDTVPAVPGRQHLPVLRPEHALACSRCWQKITGKPLDDAGARRASPVRWACGHHVQPARLR